MHHALLHGHLDHGSARDEFVEHRYECWPPPMFPSQVDQICVMFRNEPGRYSSSSRVLELLYRSPIRPSIGRLQDRLDNVHIHIDRRGCIDNFVSLGKPHEPLVAELINIFGGSSSVFEQIRPWDSDYQLCRDRRVSSN